MVGPARTALRGRDRGRRLLLCAEPGRAASELAASLLVSPLLAVQPRGDGHCVLVIPGWLAGDRSTVALRRYLSILGYDVHGWGQGVNRGPTVSNVAALRRQVAELAKTSGRSVTLIGWSLGGHYAYQLARRNPANVRQVITLGTPASMTWNGSKTGSRLADQLPAGPFHTPAIVRPWHERGTLRVPVTAIHSRSDAVVAWRASLVRPAPRRENVRVHGSHLGLGHNPAVLYVISDRLSGRPERWKPFQPPPLLTPLLPG